jgi:hypothetical protein
MLLLRQVPNVVGSREGWELYIVTGGVMLSRPSLAVRGPQFEKRCSTLLRKLCVHCANGFDNVESVYFFSSNPVYTATKHTDFMRTVATRRFKPILL